MTEPQILTRSARRRLRDPALHIARTLERGVARKAETGLTRRPEAVRIASYADVPALWPLLEMEAQENAMAEVNWAKVRAVMERGLQRNGNIIGVIDAPDRPGTLAGSVCINLSTPWYSDTVYCEEIWSFVHPDYRKAKTSYANMLIDFGKWWAEQVETPLYMGIVSNVRTIGKVRLYARRLKFIGALFLHNFPPAKVNAQPDE